MPRINPHTSVRGRYQEDSRKLAKNDTILLDGIIDDLVREKVPSDRRDEVFEYFAFQQILKDYDLSQDEIKSGTVDGRNDAGIDGFFIFVNGHFLTDPDSFIWPRSGTELEIWLITCKHHDTFKQAPLDNIAASLAELFDFSRSPNDFVGEYSDEIIDSRERLRLAYRTLSPRLRSFRVNIAYASRGDTNRIGESVDSRAEHIADISKEFFSNCESRKHFIGAAELVELHRQIPSFSLELPFLEALSRGNSYLVVANLKDYFNFISNGTKLRRYLFESNVRDFMGLNQVNDDIRETLRDSSSPDFWWLNNGVTILASAASVVGKSIMLEDIQIVNGLQTTESIFRHFADEPEGDEQRSILVKVIVSNDSSARDRIIRSTNNQTAVESVSLRATDKVQRDIEERLIRSGLFYERRKNYYTNQGQAPSAIVSPMYLAAGYVALVLKNPQRARTLRMRFLRSDESYKRVFSESVPIDIWPAIARIHKSVDAALTRRRPKGGSSGEKFLKTWRYLTSFLTTVRRLRNFQYSAIDLAQIDMSTFSEQLIDETLQLIWEGDSPIVSVAEARQHVFIAYTARKIADADGISSADEWLRHGKQKLPRKRGTKSGRSTVVTDEFALRVNELLPNQPWKPGAHRQIMRALGCSQDEYFAATRILIELGLRNRQRDGVVFDKNNKVIAVDEERVDPETLLLRRAQE